MKNYQMEAEIVLKEMQSLWLFDELDGQDADEIIIFVDEDAHEASLDEKERFLPMRISDFSSLVTAYVRDEYEDFHCLISEMELDEDGILHWDNPTIEVEEDDSEENYLSYAFASSLTDEVTIYE